MYVIMYHYVRNIANSRHPGIKGLELEMFKQQIQFLEGNGYEFVTLDNILENKITRDKSVLLTFDDGYSDHYENVFPILREKNIQGIFSMPAKIVKEKKALDVNKIHYILASEQVDTIKTKLLDKMNYYRGNEFDFPRNEEIYEKLAVANRFDDKDTIFIKRTLQVELPEQVRNMITQDLFSEIVTSNEADFVNELYMNLEQIKEMKAAGMVFGYHGYDHYWLNHLTEEELTKDIGRAMDVFDGVIDPKGWTCCYPYGSYSDEVIATVKSFGATSGFSTDVDAFHLGDHDIFKIPRLDTNDYPPKSDNYKKYM